MITRYLEASSLFEVGVGQRWGGGIAEPTTFTGLKRA